MPKGRRNDPKAAAGPSDDPVPIRVSQRGTYRRLPFSGLTGRILLLNVLGLAVLVVGILYVNQYRTSLIEARMTALRAQAESLASTLGETTGGVESTSVDVRQASSLLQRLISHRESRVRVFNVDGTLAVDTRQLVPGAQVITSLLPPPGEEPEQDLQDYWLGFQSWIIRLVTAAPDYPQYTERFDQDASDYAEVLTALDGQPDSAVRIKDDGTLVLTVAMPVQRLRRILGAMMLSVETTEIEEAVRQERLAILEIFLVALGVMILLSLLLAGTIARPVRRLAAFAHVVRQGRGRDVDMPDFSHRMDEVGDLSRALRDMTRALYQRIDAIEAFAADVAHEFKNPLTSLRSAVETMDRTENPDHQTRLVDIIKEDVGRLDRLISDISNASRLDAEMLRAEMDVIDMPALLNAITAIYDSLEAEEDGSGQRDIRIELTIKDSPSLSEGTGMTIYGLESHISQVIRNLIDNARSFSPEGGVIRVGATRDDDNIIITVEDDGPGIPEDKCDKIFERFYSERPDSQGFGNHSGLGLNICKQIVQVHDGTITAGNRYGSSGPDGGSLGARFVITLPAADAGDGPAGTSREDQDKPS